MDFVLLFPGQGSQKPGMGADLAQTFPESRAVFALADATLGRALSTLCFDGPADALTLTRNAQPALLTHSAAVLAALGPRVTSRVRAAAGHSLGELSAYHAAGSLSLAAAVALVETRGELMHRAGSARAGGMAAILGHADVPVDALCDEASRDTQAVVVAANYNHPEQTVVSGDNAAVDRLIALAKQHGAKHAMKLRVSGAFHSPLMAPAVHEFQRVLATTPFATPSLPVYANVTADPVTDAQRAIELLVEQLTAPVRWVECVERLAQDVPDALFVEVGPGAVLTGLVKKIAPALHTATCGTVAEVERIRGLVA
jgi:[acyl-carrier-protein] S-malonyltransferase